MTKFARPLASGGRWGDLERDQSGHFAQVLGGGGEEELVSGAAGSAKAQPIQPEDALEVGEQHLDLLPLAPGGDVGIGPGDVAGDVPGVFVDGTRHLPSRPVGAAVGLQRAGVAIDLGGAIPIGVIRRRIGMIGAEGSPILLQFLAARTAIKVGGGIIGKVGSGEGPVRPARLVDDRDVGSDPLIVDQPFQHLGRAIGGAGGRVGPDLTNLIYRDYDSVLRDIANPNAAINPEHVAYTVTKKDGSEITAVLLAENSSSVSLAQIGAPAIEIPRTDITGMKQLTISLMPSGLDKAIDPKQLRDLMSYLLLAPK